MKYGLRVTTPPTGEPISHAEARAHLRVDSYEDDGIIAGLILAARQMVEDFTGRALCTQTVEVTLDEFPECGTLELPRAPAVSITSITYIDTAGATQTWAGANYKLDTKSLPPRLTPVYGGVWPSTRGETSAVTVTYVAGYGGPELVPDAIKQAMLLLIGHWYENREAVNIGNITGELPFTTRALLEPYRTVWF